MRNAILENVLKTIICRTPYLKWMANKDNQKILCPFCRGFMRPVSDKDTK